ncbi:MAG TPA: nucleoside phosphorylase [Chitinophagales bacterium]|nr:nucleoside phosphorylase [Chitinophagales bacterium]
MDKRVPPASELITNPDGSIYHLHLHPHEIADTIITVGDQERVSQVSRHFDRIVHQQHKREFITHTGYIGNKHLTVISTGIGPDNIDIVLNELHALRHFDMHTHQPVAENRVFTIIRFGTSGAIQADIEPGTLLCSAYAIGIDNVMHFYRQQPFADEVRLLETFNQQCHLDKTITPYVYAADPTLLAHFSSVSMTGITLTAPGFYAPQGRAVNLPLSHPEFYTDIQSFRHDEKRITNFEMETATMYGLCRLLGHRCLSFNVLLANRATGKFHTHTDTAIDHMIDVGLERILSL